MITLQDLKRHLEELFPKEPDGCPNGLQVEGVHQVKKIATGVTADVETIREAAEWGANALVVHHGLFWNRQEVRLIGGMRERVVLLIDHNISLFGYHLPMDMHETIGNNWKAARDLGLKELQPFGGVGVKGHLEPTPINDWVKRVETYYAHPATKALGGGKTVHKVGIVSGGAYRLLDAAIEEGLDCFVTGNYDLPAWPTAREGGIHFLAMGHSATERVGPRELAAHLAERFHLEARFIDTENPF